MPRVDIRQTIQIYEEDDEELSGGGKLLGIDSHWNRNDMVILVIGRKKYTVVADDLILAVKNAMNTGG